MILLFSLGKRRSVVSTFPYSPITSPSRGRHLQRLLHIVLGPYPIALASVGETERFQGLGVVWRTLQDLLELGDGVVELWR